MTRQSTWAACLLTLLALAGPAGAQEPAPVPTPTPAPYPALEPALDQDQGAAPARTPLTQTVDNRPQLALSLEDAVKRALENNVDIAVARYNPRATDENLKELQGNYDPLLTSTIAKNSRTSPATNAFSGGEKVTNDTFTANFAGVKNLRTGGNVNASFNNNRQGTNSVFSTFNPQFGSTFNLGFEQPFLRNFHTDSLRYQINVTKTNRLISDVQFRQTVTNTVAGVKNAYYDLLYAIDNLEAQRGSLALAGRLLEENRIRVRVGTMAPLDVVSAESEQASREEAVILAEAAVGDAEDALKRAIFPTNDPANWDLRIVPSDRPTAEPFAVDTATAVRVALEKRTDIDVTRRNLEIARLTEGFARNQTLPQLDLVAGYGTTGIGGTLLQRDGLGGPIISSTPGGLGDAFSSVLGRDFPTWSIGVNVGYSLFNRSARAAQARARISREQAEAGLHRLEMDITAEVRTAARAVETNYKRVESTRAARVLAERRLDAEGKKFAAGMSTNFLVTQSQRDLALAQVAELRAVADYRKSLVNFERVQETGLSGTGSQLSVTSSSSSRTGSGSTSSNGTGSTSPTN